MKGFESRSETGDGFAFSTAEIHAAIDRECVAGAAVVTDISKYKPGKFGAAAWRAA